MLDIKDKIQAYLANKSHSINEEIEGITEILEDEFFEEVFDFLSDIDEENLSDDMVVRLDQILEVLDEFDFDGEYENVEDESEIEEGALRYLKRTTRKTRRIARQRYRRNRAKIKARRRRLKHKIKRMKQMGRGLTGKRLGLTKRRGF
jgi:ribosomal protein S21